MPSRNALSNYRYAFQGQEIDQETGMEAFQLRLWDGRIGRWLSPDPMGEYSSPYLGMGNNPIILIDPDGGQTIDPPVNTKPSELNEVVVYSKPKSIKFKMDWSFSRPNGSNLSFDSSWKRLSFPTFNTQSSKNIKDVNNIAVGWISQYDASQVERAGGEACKRACYLMMETAGFKPQRGMVNGYYIARENNEVISILSDSNKGIEYLNKQLISGTPVIVGVARDKMDTELEIKMEIIQLIIL